MERKILDPEGAFIKKEERYWDEITEQAMAHENLVDYVCRWLEKVKGKLSLDDRRRIAATLDAVLREDIEVAAEESVSSPDERADLLGCLGI